MSSAIKRAVNLPVYLKRNDKSPQSEGQARYYNQMRRIYCKL